VKTELELAKIKDTKTWYLPCYFSTAHRRSAYLARNGDQRANKFIIFKVLIAGDRLIGVTG
jgi:hypothetical protein